MRRCSLRPHGVLGSLLSELLVRCAHASAGCAWTGRQDQRQAHMDACPVVLLERANGQIAELEQRLLESDHLAAVRGVQIADYEVRLAHLRRMVGSRDTVERSQAANASLHFSVAEPSFYACTSPQSALTDAARRDELEVQIFVKSLSGKTLVFRACLADVVGCLRRDICCETQISAHCFYLSYGGHVLADDRPASDYGISRDSTVTMVARSSFMAGPIPLTATSAHKASSPRRPSSSHKICDSSMGACDAQLHSGSGPVKGVQLTYVDPHVALPEFTLDLGQKIEMLGAEGSSPGAWARAAARTRPSVELSGCRAIRRRLR